MQFHEITLTSASGNIAFHTLRPAEGTLANAILSKWIGEAKRATVRTGDGDVYLNSPLAPEAEDIRGILPLELAIDLLKTWAGA